MKTKLESFFWIERTAVRLFLTVFSFLVTPLCFSQNLTPQARLTPFSDDLFNGRPFAKPPSNVIGDINFNEDWLPVSVTLYDEGKKIEGYDAKFNIYFNELDFNTKNGVKALEGEKIKMFTIKDGALHTFINAKDFEKDKVSLKAFLEVIVAGQWPLYKFHYLVVQNPDYNPALNSGSRDTRIHKKFDFHTAKGNSLFEIKGKKKMLAFFGEKSESIDRYIKMNHLSIGEESDLIKLFTFINGPN